MGIILSQRVQKIKPSPTLAVSAKAASLRAEGKDIIGLGTGEPDFDTPEHIKNAAQKAMDAGFTKYTPVDGIPQLKEAIATKFANDNQLSYKADQILVSVGGKQSIFNLCQALLNEGDEVIIPAPYWVSYPDIALLCDATPKIVTCSIDNDYKLTPQQLKDAITDKTRLFFINSPSNPTGKAYTFDELKALGEILKEHPNVIIATDDMYEHILWNGTFANILNATPELTDRTVVLNGVSKAYAMTGWRIGYAGGPAELIKAMKKVQSQSTSNPCSIAQYAATEALSGTQEPVAKMLEAFKARHQLVFERLSTMPGVKVSPSDGTFYIFPDVSDIIKRKGLANDVALTEALLSDVGLALVPGSAFGLEGAVRLSFATSEAILTDALDRLENYIG